VESENVKAMFISGLVLDSGGKTPIMKSKTGGFSGKGCGEAGDIVRLVIPAESKKYQQGILGIATVLCS
jgi:hypothetical protein